MCRFTTSELKVARALLRKRKDSPAPGAVKGLVAEAWLRRALQKEKGIVGGT